jgi:hypothetical protein
MLNLFRKITTLDRLNKQITLTEESLIVNMHNAEHFAANAEGNRKQLIRLRAMKSAETAEPLVAIAKGNRKQLIKMRAMKSAETAEPSVAIVKGTAPRLATSK